jgi:hypothetical protein
MNNIDLNNRATELMEPINKAIMMCDNRNDLLILCFSMLNRSREILDTEVGESTRKSLFNEHT